MASSQTPADTGTDYDPSGIPDGTMRLQIAACVSCGEIGITELSTEPSQYVCEECDTYHCLHCESVLNGCVRVQKESLPREPDTETVHCQHCGEPVGAADPDLAREIIDEVEQ